jgi:hypothetical protein
MSNPQQQVHVIQSAAANPRVPSSCPGLHRSPTAISAASKSSKGSRRSQKSNSSKGSKTSNASLGRNHTANRHALRVSALADLSEAVSASLLGLGLGGDSEDEDTNIESRQLYKRSSPKGFGAFGLKSGMRCEDLGANSVIGMGANEGGDVNYADDEGVFERGRSGMPRSLSAKQSSHSVSLSRWGSRIGVQRSISHRQRGVVGTRTRWEMDQDKIPTWI